MKMKKMHIEKFEPTNKTVHRF